MSWTKESAVAELRSLASETLDLTGGRFSEPHTRWRYQTVALLDEVFGKRSRYCSDFMRIPWQHVGLAVFGGPADPAASLNPAGAIEELHERAYERDLETARGLLQAAAHHLERTSLEAVYEGKDTGPESSAILRVINLAEHKLRKVIRNQPQQERDVQDAFENLLIGADIPHSRETDSIEYSSKTYTPDFTVPQIDLAIEVKLCGRGGREKEIIAEINDDILAYQTKYGNQLFVVYDVGLIRDIERFTSAFEAHENVVVRVVKH